MDNRKKIKELIEDLNYRTDYKSSEEIYELSRALFELAVLNLKGAALNTSEDEQAQVQMEPQPEIAQNETPKKIDPLVNEVVDLINPEPAQISEAPIPDEQSEVEEVRDMEQKSTPESLRDTDATSTPPKSLNDSLGKTLNIGFNDRFAFVNKLFEGNQDDYNRVISQLNTMTSFIEARNFIESIVKPDYNWNDKEEYELRFMEIIERHFN